LHSRGAVAQLGARLDGIEEVAGSNPAGSTKPSLVRQFPITPMIESRRKRAVAAVLFSSIMACLLGFVGLLTGMYVWSHFGHPAHDPDDTDAYLCGLLVGSVTAIGGGAALLWWTWPRVSPKASQARHYGEPF
jgi:hypothetical protein